MQKISLKAARVNAELTQEQVAEKMNIDRQTVINWEKGNTRVGTAQLMMLSQIYDLSVDYIFLPNKSTNSRQIKGGEIHV